MTAPWRARRPGEFHSPCRSLSRKGEIQRLRGDTTGAAQSDALALGLFLELLQTSVVSFELIQKTEGLIERTAGTRLPAAVLRRLLSYYEARRPARPGRGRSLRMARRKDPAAAEGGLTFYDRLSKSDSELNDGGLPRAEVDQGRAEWLRRSYLAYFARGLWRQLPISNLRKAIRRPALPLPRAAAAPSRCPTSKANTSCFIFIRAMIRPAAPKACGFRDAYAQFKKAGAVVLGVSIDPVKSHDKFITKLNSHSRSLPTKTKRSFRNMASGARNPLWAANTWARTVSPSSSTAMVASKRFWPTVKPEAHPAEVPAALR